MAGLSERFEMRLDQEIVESVDSWRAKQPGVPSRAEAIRRLVERGLGNDKDRIHFSPGETLLLHMMCALFKSLKVKSDFDVDFIRDALLGGHLWAFDWEMQGTFHHHVDSPDMVSEVVSILEMWDFIELSYEKLDKKQKAYVENEAEPFGKDPKFQGFDGNSETEYMGIANFLINKMDRFSRFKSRGMNSHFPTSSDGYRRMLKVCDSLRPTLVGATLTPEQLVLVLKERIHPSQRGKKK